MTFRARSLIVAAGFAFALPFALAASDDDHAHHDAPAAKHTDDKADTKPSAKPAPHPAAKPTSKPKASIWDSAKSKSKAKPAEQAADDYASDETEEHDGHAPAARAKPVVKTTSKTTPKATDTTTEKPAASAEPASISADDALALLTEGNLRWAEGTPINPSIDTDRREDLAANGQHPFVTVLTCADSRIPVERVFDRGVGEVFTVRVAGNVAGDSEAGTIEYGVGHLKTGLLIVMGHTKCGAVAAACSGAQVHGKVAGLIQHVAPAVERAKRNNPNATDAELATLAERENVWQSVFDILRASDEVRGMVASKNLKVVGAIYDISSGKVEFLGEHPWQTELAAAIDSTKRTGTTMTVAVEADDTAEAEEHH